MKIGRPVSSLSLPEQSPPPVDGRASGQSTFAGGRGSSSSAQGYRGPPDQFQGGPVGDGGEARPCASGSSARGGGHSGSVSCSFVPADSGAAGPAGSKPSTPLEKFAEKLRDLFSKLLGGDLPEGSRRGRLATGDSSRSSGSTHSGSGQGRIGAEEELQADGSSRSSREPRA
ncbi:MULTISPECIES: hypothetical protein [unclassified Corallococcus]|uniref:hypothetical protein n=1 Tax=unclassified Corallococcus TaxID=2685029 RepID=UPI001A90931F|nr:MULTISPECIES: hypothetical protein [unclassified Corallococcus]MBN9684327.1 hypothetical protein [Corallococcus sp. NCSPR001]WAS84193.1 hypothetical protein O0N60_33500 [Corallococcus sp. NCRR]